MTANFCLEEMLFLFIEKSAIKPKTGQELLFFINNSCNERKHNIDSIINTIDKVRITLTTENIKTAIILGSHINKTYKTSSNSWNNSKSNVKDKHEFFQTVIHTIKLSLTSITGGLLWVLCCSCVQCFGTLMWVLRATDRI